MKQQKTKIEKLRDALLEAEENERKVNLDGTSTQEAYEAASKRRQAEDAYYNYLEYENEMHKM